MTRPAVSVVMPVYNGADTIAETIDSVLRQDFGDFELIIINDGSTDETTHVVEEYDDRRIQRHDFENRGLAASRNRGIRLANAGLVAFIDADDLWTKDKLAAQVDALARNAEAALVYSLTDSIDENSVYLGNGSHIVESGHVYEKLVVRNFLDNGSTATVRREVFDRVGNFDETLDAAEDWDLWLRIAHVYPITCVPEVQVLYRVHIGAMSSNIDRQARACFRVLENAVARLPDTPQSGVAGREGFANLHRYLAGRILATAVNQRVVLPAWRHWWQWIWLIPNKREPMPVFVSYFVRLVILSTLPHRWARPLLTTLVRWRSERD